MKYLSSLNKKLFKTAIKGNTDDPKIDLGSKIYIAVVILIFSLFFLFAFNVLGIEFWVFENYNLGNVVGQYDWTSAVSSHTITTTTLPYAPNCIFGDRCLKVLPKSAMGDKPNQLNEAEVQIGEISFWTTYQGRVFLHTTYNNYVDLGLKSNECSPPNDGEFHFLAYQWAPNLSAGYMESRCMIDDGEWQVWTEANEKYTPVHSEWTADGFNFGGVSGYILVDFIAYGSSLGDCGSGDNCILCDLEGSCLSKGCLWTELPYGEGYCSEDTSPIEDETSTLWINYYEDHSDYETSTVLFNSLAIMTQPFLSILSNWLDSFSDYFDLADAQEKGEDFGNAIPLARGYLTFFNSFFADFPISEALIIYLVVLISVIIFRIIRQIKKLLTV